MARSSVPVYVRLKETIRAGIDAGEWKAGDTIPSEREICAAYGISRMTARQAIGDLVHEGVLTRRQGRGTFVAHPKIAQRLRYLTGFTQDMAARGLVGTSTLLNASLAAAPDDVARELGVRAGRALAYVERLRLANGAPVGIERAWLAISGAEKLIASDLSTGSLYERLAELGHHPVRAEQEISASLANERETELLGLGPGAPVLRTKRRSFDDAGRAIELAEAVYRGDAYAFTSELIAKTEA